MATTTGSLNFNVNGPIKRVRSRSMSKRFKAVLLLCAGCFALQSIFEESITAAKRRRLACKPLNKDDIRGLSKFGRLADQVVAGIDRVLEIGDDGSPCITDFPVEVELHVEELEFEFELEEFLIGNGTAANETDISDEPEFIVVDEDDEFLAEPDENGTISLVPEVEVDEEEEVVLDIAERALVESFEVNMTNYDPELAVERATYDEQTIAYVVSLTGCPVWYEPEVDTTSEPDAGSELYEASAILKSEVCAVTDTAAENRKLGLTRKLVELGDRQSAADMEYTMHAMLHPMSIECPVQGTEGETYDRVQLLQSENYKVEILGHPISEEILNQNGHYYISQNIADDVGIRDFMKLHAWTLIDHAAVVMLDYATIIREPIDAEIDLILSDDNFKGAYIPMKPYEGTGKFGVDTGFMIIKPNVTEYQNIIDEYLNTPYDPQNGWNNEGFDGFPGELGLPGFLAYYFNKDPGYIPMDRCTYAHTADDDCLLEHPMNTSKVLRVYRDVCGTPRTCPYDNPHWSPAKKASCGELHRSYFEHRYSFEQEFFNKDDIQERIGMFKSETFLGYCTGAGSDSYLSMTGSITPKPAWQIVCPPQSCPLGTFLKSDCTCTEPHDPCAACPLNTRCQTFPSLMCIDCSCGFCDGSLTGCCEFNGQNDCMAGSGVPEQCSMFNNNFPAFSGYGYVCGGVETSRTSLPNGCGCKPSIHSPCTYNKDWGTKEDKCFVCTASDLAEGESCETCKDCLSGCPNGDCISNSTSTEELSSCLNTITDVYCRASCHFNCMKN